MALIISCLGKKGGCFKSTLTRLIACEYAANEWAVKIADFDTGSHTCADWHKERLKKGIKPEIDLETFNNINKVKKQVDHYDLIAIDGTPYGTEISKAISRFSDLAIISTSTAKDTLNPQIEIAHLMVKDGIEPNRIAFVMCGIMSEPQELSSRAYIVRAGYEVLVGSIPHKQHFENLQEQGKALTETYVSSLKERADEVAQSIMDKAASLTKEKNRK